MRTAFQNILYFFKNNKLVFLVFILCQLVTCITTLYIFSVFWSTQLDRIQRNETYCTFSIYLKSADLSIKEIYQLQYEKNYKKATVYLDKYNLQAQVTYPPQSDRFTVTGSYFSFSAFETGSHQIIINAPSAHLKVGDLWWSNDLPYEIIAVNYGSRAYNEVPFRALPNPKEINRITYTLNSIPNRQEKEETQNRLSELFPNSRVVSPDGVNIVILTTGFGEYFVAICVLLLALLNTSYLYQYILHRRQKQFIIMRLVGCSKNSAILIFLSEIVLIFSSVYLLSCLLLCLIIAPHFPVFNGGIPYALNAKVYFCLYPIFLCFVVLVFYRTIKKYTQANISGLI